MAKIKNSSQRPTDDRSWQNGPSDEVIPLNVPDVKIKGEKKEKKPKEKVKVIGVFELFRFADGLDKLLIFMGVLCGLINGLGFPTTLIVFGEMIHSFVGTGMLLHFLGIIGEYMESIAITKMDLVKDPLLLNCSAIHEFYKGNISCLDNLPQKSILEEMKEYSIYYCIIAGCILISAYGQVYFWTTAAERQAHKIRHACLFNVLRQDIGWFDTHDAAELNTRLGDDVHKIQDGLGDQVGSFFQWMSSCIGSIIVGFVYGWKLSLVVMGAAPVLVVSAALFSKLAATISVKELSAYAKAGAIANEVFGAIRTVVAFGGQEKEAERFKKNLSAAHAFGIKKGFSNGLSMGVIWFCVYCFFGLGYWYGGKLCREEDYNVANVIVVVFNIMVSAIALGMAAPSVETVSVARGAAYTIFQLIDYKSKIDSSSEEGLKPESDPATVKFEDVHFTYPARPDVKVLNGVSMEAKQGQTVALVGASGCGKSTVVQLLLRFYDPNEGKVLIDGRDIRDYNIKWLRRHIGLVSQEPVLFATTIAENIRYGRDDVTIEEIIEATKMANAYDFIQTLPEKFETLVGERGAQLSGGQKQRLAIARALVRDPKILLLDEATSALDAESESLVQDALDKARQGRTTIIVAHRLSTIKTADIIVGIEDGKVAEMGIHDELMEKRGIYYKLVTNQQTAPSEDLDIEEIFMEDKPKTHNMTPAKEIKSATGEKEEEEEEDLPEAPLCRILKLNAPEWYFILIGCLGSLINGGVWPTYAIVFSRVIKCFSYQDLDKQEDELRMYALLFVAIAVMSFLTLFIQHYMFGYSGEALTLRIRDLCFRSTMKQPISWFDDSKNAVGAITYRLATDASLIQGVSGQRMGALIMTASNIICALVISFIHGWQMSLVILGFLPLIVIGGVMQMKLMALQAGKNKEALETAGKVTVESITNIRTVASLSQEAKFIKMYMDYLKIPYKAALRNNLVAGFVFGIAQSLTFVTYAISFSFGAFMIEEGEMDFDEVFIVFAAIVFGSIGLGYQSAFGPDMGKARRSARRIIQMIDSEPPTDYTNPSGEKLSADYKADITFRDVEFSYPNRKAVQVLQGLTFSISHGETVALVGSSGCGKTTSVQLIERFYDSDSGQVAVDTHDVKDLNIKWLREQIGIVFQEPMLFNTSIAENIAYGDNTRTVTMDEIVAAARCANIHFFITSLPDGYDTTVGSQGTQLSGGQKQRIAIARALIRNPKILLLDEATSALDTENEKIVQEALDKAREGRTCIIIAHRLSTIQNVDKICVINHGKLSEIGTHSELMEKKDFYYKLVRKSAREVN